MKKREREENQQLENPPLGIHAREDFYEFVLRGCVILVVIPTAPLLFFLSCLTRFVLCLSRFLQCLTRENFHVYLSKKIYFSKKEKFFLLKLTGVFLLFGTFNNG